MYDNKCHPLHRIRFGPCQVSSATLGHGVTGTLVYTCIDLIGHMYMYMYMYVCLCKFTPTCIYICNLILQFLTLS